MAFIISRHTFGDTIIGFIAMMAAVIITACHLFWLIFDRGYLIDFWNQNTIFANTLYVISSIFAFFITLIFIYGVITMISRREDDEPVR